MTRKLSTQSQVSALALAAVLVMGASTAAAQSFNADGIVSSGTGSITEGVGTTNVSIGSPQVVIDWTPDDNAVGPFGAIDFQSADTVASFFSGSDFAVLNRVNVADPSRIIALNGTIQSFAGDFTGGSVFFYSPSGFVVGASAVINVGSLVLSASPIAVDGNGGFIQGGSVTFNQAPNPGATISTAPGSQINANGAGSYVALIAPSITHRGTIRTDTAAALIAAEAATVTFSPDGLFDVQVTVGTDAETGINVDGGTITRNNAPEGDSNHYAYLMAVAKNDAVTMLVQNGGSIGFETANSATLEQNGVLVLGGADMATGSVGSFGVGEIPVDVDIDASSFSSNTHIFSTSTIDVSSSGFGATDFGGNLSFQAAGNVVIEATGGSSLSIAGDLSGGAYEFGPNQSVIGKSIRLGAYQGSDLIVGNVSLGASSVGETATASGENGGNATGGTVTVQAGSGGSILIAGNLDLTANGLGGDADGGAATGGSGTGGLVQILSNNGGSSVTIRGDTTLAAEGEGGSIFECSSCGVTGGAGTGGRVEIFAAQGLDNVITLGNLDASASGQGGAGDAGGGSGTGGTIQMNSANSAITVNGTFIAGAPGVGGFGFNSGPGGNALGGAIVINFLGTGGTIDLIGDTFLSASAFGASGLTGGDAKGGDINIQAGVGGVLTAGVVYANADGDGGSGDIGGDGTGGQVLAQSITGGTLTVDSLNLSAGGFGGTGFVGGGGNGLGGKVVASADSATTDIIDVTLSANGVGGETQGDTAPGGTGTGGQADVFADHAGIMTVTGRVVAEAIGRGGGNFLETAQGGAGTGGTVFYQASNGAALSTTGNVFLDAQGYGGFAGGDCNDCGGEGSNGTGGTITVQAFGGPGAKLTIGGNLDLNADGNGSSGYGGPGGNGQGGQSSVSIATSGEIDIIGSLDISAAGWGGSQDNGGVAGSATGGLAQVALDTSDGLLTVGGASIIDAGASGGDSFGFGGTGGNSVGGTARVLMLGGTANFLSDLSLWSNATGGFSNGGTGGNARSGRTRVNVDGGDLTVGADLTLESISTGGDGVTGGNGLAFIGTNPIATATSDARVLAGNGSVTVTGFTTLDVHAQGGNGSFSGNGGNATAGYATVHARNRDAGAGTVTVGDITVNAEAYGGAGGTGSDSTDAGDGGTGGSATGGFVVITAAAGNGHLTAGDVSVSASAFGGSGGNGGNGDGGTGGDGGDGGQASGGNITVGAESGEEFALAANNGSAAYGTVAMLASATGGSGGNGTFGSVNGVAGNGGDAFGGDSTLLVRGSNVTVGNVLMAASATGGDGGQDPFEVLQGDGGDATAGSVYVLVTNRFTLPAQRSILDAGLIFGTAEAVGGSGVVGGASWTLGDMRFEIVNSDATIDAVSMSVLSDGLHPTLSTFPSAIAIVNGTATVTGGFNFVTPGLVSAYAENGTLNAASISIAGDSFIHDPSRPLPSPVGVFNADSVSLATDGDLIVDAHIVSVNSLGLSAPGLVDLENVTSSTGAVDIRAGTSLAAANLSAAGGIYLEAGTSVTAGNGSAGAGFESYALGGPSSFGNIDAADYIRLISLGGITAGNLFAGGEIELESDGDILFGDADAGDDLDFDASGSVTGGDVVAGTRVGGEAGGAVVLGDISAGLAGPGDDGFSVGLVSATSISVGDVSGVEAVGFATFGDLATGDIDADGGLMALVGGDMTFGAIATNSQATTYLAHSSMFVDAGGLDDEFDPSLVLALDPVPSGGSITINGSVSSGQFRAAAGDALMTLGIAAQSIEASAGGLASVNGLWSAGSIALTSNDIEIGANGGIDAGLTGPLLLASSNATQALIGDGLSGTGYALSNAEISRIRGGSILIAARGDASAPIDMLIGDLTLTGPLAGSNIDNPNGIITFATGNIDTFQPGGVIRVVGDVAAIGFQNGNALEFVAGRFDLDADSGSIKVEGSPGVLDGILDITADRIHVASVQILDQLAANPTYAGREDELNTPLSTARPDGVIAAGTIFVSPTEAVLVQNTGTADLPAGFRAGFVELFPPEGAAPGSIELIVNGQLVTANGTLTGVAVRDALVVDTDLAVYSDNSSINGCPLTGDCVPPSFFPPGFIPTPGIQDEVVLIDRDPLPPPFFGNEDIIDDNDEETDDGSTSPIVPPRPLFDTSELGDPDGAANAIGGTPMRSDSALKNKGDIDDPVSGSGNPALMDVPPPSGSEEKQP